MADTHSGCNTAFTNDEAVLVDQLLAVHACHPIHVLMETMMTRYGLQHFQSRKLASLGRQHQ